MKILKKTLVTKPVKIRSDFTITCYTFEGNDAIKEALVIGEKKGTNKYLYQLDILVHLYMNVVLKLLIKKKDLI